MTIAIVGANGRMGTMVDGVAQSHGHQTIAIDIDTDISNMSCDIVVDFSTSSDNALDKTLMLCQRNKCPLVSGVTGYNDGQLHLLNNLSTLVPVVHKSNFCIGIDTLYHICTTLSQMLPQWQYTIIEQHHAGKADNPSGTALTLANALPRCTIHGIRAGTTQGTHTIITNGIGECITITHTAENREIFALGAIAECEKLCR